MKIKLTDENGRSIEVEGDVTIEVVGCLMTINNASHHVLKCDPLPSMSNAVRSVQDVEPVAGRTGYTCEKCGHVDDGGWNIEDD